MNHHDFRTFVKEMSSEDIKLANINPAHFKAVCYTLSMYGDYATGTDVRPSWLTVAREAGVDRKTAMKVRDFLIDHGILVKVRVNEANISEYEFASCPKKDEQLSNSQEQLSSIDGHNTTIYTTNNNKGSRTFTSRRSLEHSSLLDWK